ncbi:hypothetical protein B7463_g9151, partial [Scytalidium lignicola]
MRRLTGGIRRSTEILTSTFGLVFFGTPHAGATDEAKVVFGKICARVAKKVIGHPQNDIMEALEKNSLFSDILQENWRHQLERYQILSFYEGIGNIVPRDSAVIGLPGEREYAVRINAEHRDMCRFDPSIQDDEDNYQLVEANLEELCTDAIKQEFHVVEDLQMDILQNLEPASRNPRFNEISTAYQESFRWLWNEGDSGPGFVNWLQNGSGMYWISGKPGSGKSTLMKYIVEEPKTVECLRYASNDSHLLLLCHSLSAHSGSSDLIPAILPFWNAAIKMVHYGTGQVKITASDIENCLLAISRQKNIEGTVCLFIDGLDECIGDWHQELQLLDRLVQVNPGQKLQFKVCVSSRPENIIRDYLGKHPGLRIHERTFKDILNYVQSQLAEKVAGMSCIINSERYSGGNLIEDIVKKASGVFMWVRLAVHDLMEGCVQGDILRSSVGFFLSCHRISNHFTSESHIDNEPASITRITFLHKTAKEYLNKPETTQALLARSIYPSENPWVQLMSLSLFQLKLILDYQPFNGDKWDQTISQFFHFARYSELSTGLPQNFLMEGMNYYLTTLDQNWCTTWWVQSRTSCQHLTTFLELAVRFGCVLYVEQKMKHLQRSMKDPNGSLKTIPPNVPFRGTQVIRPLLFFSLDIGMVAEEWLPEDMIEVLLNQGINVNDSFEGITFWQQVLLSCVDFSVPMHTERVLSLLLDHGADPSQSIDLGGHWCTPFHRYLHALNHKTDIEPLFKRFYGEPSVNSFDFAWFRRNAILSRPKSPVKFPTGRGAIADERISLMYYCHISSMMRKFLDCGCDLQSKDSNGMTVLELCNGMPTVLQFLREYKPEYKPELCQKTPGQENQIQKDEKLKKIRWHRKILIAAKGNTFEPAYYDEDEDL